MNTFKHQVVTTLRHIKENSPTRTLSILPIFHKNEIIAYLRAVTRESIRNPQEIRMLAQWRRAHDRYFPSQFRVTLAGTKRWAMSQLIAKEDRILFMIEDLRGHAVGHLGLYRFNYVRKSCEIDNVIRGERGLPGIMTAAVNMLCEWGKTEFGIKTYELHVVAENTDAVTLYKRCGFVETESIPIHNVSSGGHVITWEPFTKGSNKGDVRHLLRMKRAAGVIHVKAGIRLK